MARSHPEVASWVWGSAAAFGFALLYQHRLVTPGQLAHIDRAFFTTNGVASVAYAVLLVGGLCRRCTHIKIWLNGLAQ